ncbi:MAG: sigma-70 family RNA polymerase sigma factor [Actinomycetota bacterium]
MAIATNCQQTRTEPRGRTGRANRSRTEQNRSTDRSERTERSDLLAAARTGDNEAWHAIVDRYGPLVTGQARRLGLSPTQSDDVAQLTWLRLAASLDTMREPERLAGWLSTTARNAAIDLLRREWRFVPTDEVDRWRHPGAEPDTDLLNADARAAVYEAIDTLTERQRAVVRLRYLEDQPLPYAEIIDRLDIRPGAIGPTLMRALGRLRHHPEITGLR